MKYREARELQERVLQQELYRLPTAERLQDRAESEEEGRAGAPAPAFPADLAIGVQGRDDDYQLAVRAFEDTLEVRRAVRRIEELAPVDFQVLGNVVALSKPWHQDKIRPLWPGCSAAHWQVGLGTLGCFVTRRGDSSRWPHILSNNHVFAWERDDDEPREDNRIFQPADDDETVLPDESIADLVHWIPLKDEGNTVDAAIARLYEGVSFEPTKLHTLGNLAGVRSATKKLAEGDIVQKVGRTTGATTGLVKAVRMEPLNVEFDSGFRSFRQVIEIEPTSGTFSDLGDSGSLIVDEDRRAAALLFAKSEKTGNAYANPIHEVLDALEVDLLLEVTNP